MFRVDVFLLIFDMTDKEVEMLATHLGHDVKTHREYYRLQLDHDVKTHREYYRLHSSTVELSQVSSLLH